MARVEHAVTFRSSAFPAESGEEASINPGRFGIALARWVHTQLAAAGIGADEPIFEDWGVLIGVRGPGHVTVACGNVDDEDDELAIQVSSRTSRFRTPDPEATDLVDRTVAAIDAALLAHPDVGQIEWTEGGPLERSN